MGNYAIYLRKSRADEQSESQDETDVLKRHESILLELARKLNLGVSEIYREVVSGDTISARPVMQRLLNEVGQGLWDGVLVTEIERLARGDTVDQGMVARAFKFTNTKIITPIKIYDPQNEFDETFFEFGLFMSRQEYKTIRRRMLVGKDAAVKSGQFIGNRAPYGYIKAKRGKDLTLEINMEQAEIVKSIYKMYTSEHDRMGYNGIRDKLNDMGIPSPTGGAWGRSSIRNILKNPVYIGKLHWHYHKNTKKIVDGAIVATRTINKKGADYILTDGIHEPIIDVETWNKAQFYSEMFPKPSIPGNKEMRNPFAGLIICGMCGKKMERGIYKNYTMPGILLCTGKNCKNVSAYLDIVESEILNSLKIWLKDYKLKLVSSKPLTPDKNNILLKEKVLKNYISEKEALQKQLERVYVSFEKGIYDSEEFLERSSALKKNISDLEKTIKETEKEIRTSNSDGQNIPMERVEYIIDAYGKIKSCAEKNKLLKEIIDKIVYVKEKRNHKSTLDNKFEIKIFPKIK